MASTLAIGVVMVSLLAGHASARTPLLYVEDNNDGAIFVKATLFEGASTAGMRCRLEDKDGNVLWQGNLDQYGALTVKKPQADPYFVVFDAGAGYVVKEQGRKLSPWEKRALTTEEQVSAPRTPEGPGQGTTAAPQPTSPWPPGAFWQAPFVEENNFNYHFVSLEDLRNTVAHRRIVEIVAEHSPYKP